MPVTTKKGSLEAFICDWNPGWGLDPTYNSLAEHSEFYGIMIDNYGIMNLANHELEVIYDNSDW